ncbi:MULTISPECIES: YciI family protein [unclassified Nocardioides]|uniref:YciI family protein n=1 Tax=unclassified Nocardioides TaxID=2615069 RepID=UPI0006F8BE38|nr:MULTISPECIES: YciI family protein [unclassified Nocardioides]KQY56876.1 hypothetical protein ASD30_11325 [Nocardioides sp. Root140]KQZ66928.1 hypothetical protein ASD66_18120 [Nocardioides sp. Root151]KRF12998.1 hypothetical protein ASH02_15970 [Nocardioides sp. Soil796]
MSRFVFIYRAAGRGQSGLDLPAEQLDAINQEWLAWSQRVGDRMVDFGNPLASGTRVTPESESPSSSDVVGYTIVEADDLEAALDLARDHPHLKTPGDCTIDVQEAQPVPGT